MGKLKSYQEQIQDAVEKGIKTVEEQHRTLAAKPFEYAEKIEQEAKNLSVKSVREMHDQLLDNVYSSFRAWNKRVNDFAADMVAKIEGAEKDSDDEANKSKATAKKTTKTAEKPASKTTEEEAAA
ncbi:hypothetical protein O5O45_28610 [Hahella aquimaris]|uniref:hypothetical protein n=1 Tax=Hahella sp. HNIBRBA332 TaxID=3015983 RepID=UPI00273B5018|nr:hypothetical protein [Hahella sp. HNIBRBA332]WLQ13695.1 hypothetical protein O5O45_28610 [Hahella sp. HNIBRBA332]